jgi:hypothetical protein
MKRLLLIFVIIQIGCSYPMTTFWINNNTEKEVHFTAGAIHLPSQSIQTLPFSIPPNDSILLRRIGLKEGANITNVFGNISFMTIDSIEIKDPMNPENWQKGKDKNGKTTFIFRVNPNNQ